METPIYVDGNCHLADQWTSIVSDSLTACSSVAYFLVSTSVHQISLVSWWTGYAASYQQFNYQTLLWRPTFELWRIYSWETRVHFNNSTRWPRGLLCLLHKCRDLFSIAYVWPFVCRSHFDLLACTSRWHTLQLDLHMSVWECCCGISASCWFTLEGLTV